MAQFRGYNKNDFIRAGGGVNWESREAQPSDFTDTTHGPASGDSYAQRYADSPSTFFIDYPAWQNFADYFIVRRATYNITGRQKCRTESFKADDMDDFIEADQVTLKNFKIPGGFQGESIPSGKWLNMGMQFDDIGDSTSIVTASYEQRLEWELIKIQDGTPPDPAGT